jgi:hypothetical protein
MKTLILFLSFLVCFSVGHTQSSTNQADNVKVLTAEDGNLSIAIQKDGKCLLTYQNGMSDKKDMRNILFKNKQDALNFEKKIGKALSAKDGTSTLIQYKTYKIRLLTEIDGVFMIVNEAGQTQSTLRISKEMYSQVNILKT